MLLKKQKKIALYCHFNSPHYHSIEAKNEINQLREKRRLFFKYAISVLPCSIHKMQDIYIHVRVVPIFLKWNISLSIRSFPTVQKPWTTNYFIFIIFFAGRHFVGSERTIIGMSHLKALIMNLYKNSLQCLYKNLTK